MALTAEQRALLESIDPKDLAAVVGRAHRAETEVRINDEDNRKYGDVSIYKVQDNGYARPKMGVFTDSIPTLVEQLEAAYAALATEADDSDA